MNVEGLNSYNIGFFLTTVELDEKSITQVSLENSKISGNQILAYFWITYVQKQRSKDAVLWTEKKNECRTLQNLWEAGKTVLRGMFIGLEVPKFEKRSQTNDFSFYVKRLEKEKWKPK